MHDARPRQAIDDLRDSRRVSIVQAQKHIQCARQHTSPRKKAAALLLARHSRMNASTCSRRAAWLEAMA